MKKPNRPRKSYLPSAQQLKGLHAATATRKQQTVERLVAAIAALKKRLQAITTQSIYEECGLRYASIHRNPEALAVFRANSTFLQEQKSRSKHKRNMAKGPTRPRDPLLNYKKPQLVERLRTLQQQLQIVEQQQSILAAACLERDARMVEMEARLAELEPYRAFVDQIGKRIAQEEHGNSSPSTQM